MKLLIINFEMDDHSGVLAWQASLARALAARCESVWVLTERIGSFAPASNLSVDRLDYRPFGIPYRAGGWLLAQWRIARECKRRGIDRCFIHMNHPWGYRLQPVFRLTGIPCVMWYAHGNVSPSLRWALRGVTRVITSTPEGFRIKSPKIRIVGQGIDSRLFRVPAFAAERNDILYVGRVSPRKRIDLLLAVMAEVAKIDPANPMRLRIVGPTLTPEDQRYDMEMRSRMWSMGLQDRVEFTGFVPQEHHPGLYASAFLHLNVSKTGSMDKTVLEALACGCPVLTSNEAFREMLSPRPEFRLDSDDPGVIARRMLAIHSGMAAYPPEPLRAMVAGIHDQDNLVNKVMAQLGEVK
ncbi:MAG: glycosyltransferase family 4 protein [Fibrobacteria bacterium]